MSHRACKERTLFRILSKREWFLITLILGLTLSVAAWAVHNFDHDVAERTICSTPNYGGD